MQERVLTALELLFVALSAVGLALVITAAVGGLLGVGVGLVSASGVVLAAAEFGRLAQARAAAAAAGSDPE